MFRAPGTLLLLAAVSWFSPVARAADTDPAHCAAIENDPQRLACYDGLFRRPGATQQVQGAPATGPSAGSAPVPTTAPVAAATTAAATAAASENARRDFGLSEADKQRNANAPASPDSISVTIRKITTRPTGQQVFETDEGQVWAEVEPNSRLRVAPGETVTIRKGALGSYTLVTSKRVGTKVQRRN